MSRSCRRFAQPAEGVTGAEGCPGPSAGHCAQRPGITRTWYTSGGDQDGGNGVLGAGTTSDGVQSFTASRYAEAVGIPPETPGQAQRRPRLTAPGNAERRFHLGSMVEETALRRQPLSALDEVASSDDRTFSLPSGCRNRAPS
jgi:hypothetical protein